MMKASYCQRGESLDYTNDSALKIEAGEVVNLITRIGVAGTEIKPREIGSVHVVGVFKMDKAASEAISMGTAVYYDETNKCITATAASNIPAGYAIVSALASDAYVYVKLLG